MRMNGNEMEGFLDCSQMMRGGVYLLKHRGEIVYVGKAKCFLSRIYSHKSMWSKVRKGEKIPSWVKDMCKGVIFDGVYLRPCAPEIADKLERELIALLKPKHNTQHVRASAPIATVMAASGLVKSTPRPHFERRI